MDQNISLLLSIYFQRFLLVVHIPNSHQHSLWSSLQPDAKQTESRPKSVFCLLKLEADLDDEAIAAEGNFVPSWDSSGRDNLDRSRPHLLDLLLVGADDQREFAARWLQELFVAGRVFRRDGRGHFFHAVSDASNAQRVPRVGQNVRKFLTDLSWWF